MSYQKRIIIAPPYMCPLGMYGWWEIPLKQKDDTLGIVVNSDEELREAVIKNGILGTGPPSEEEYRTG